MFGQGLLGCVEREITTSVSVPALPAEAASKPVLQVCRGKRPFEKLAAGRTVILHPDCGLAGFSKRKNASPESVTVIVSSMLLSCESCSLVVERALNHCVDVPSKRGDFLHCVLLFIGPSTWLHD